MILYVITACLVSLTFAAVVAISLTLKTLLNLHYTVKAYNWFQLYIVYKALLYYSISNSKAVEFYYYMAKVVYNWVLL
jgi:hypothetical protein